MEQNKEEQLKAILNKTLSQEDIEKKLKEEMKASHKKMENAQSKDASSTSSLEKENEPSNLNSTQKTAEAIEDEKKEEIKEEKLKKENTPKQTPEIKIKDEKLPINTLIYIFSAIVIVLLIVTLYLFIKQPINEKVVVKEVIKEVPKEVKVEVIKEVPKEIIKEVKVEVVKEKLVPTSGSINSSTFNKYYNASKFKTLKCYNFKTASTILTTQCKKDINKFFKENKKSVRFEIIPVLAQLDNSIYEKIEPKINEFDDSFKRKVKEYISRGLSRERVLEASAYIRKTFGEDVILTPTNYYVKSVKNNKGIIIKAYYLD